MRCCVAWHQRHSHECVCVRLCSCWRMWGSLQRGGGCEPRAMGVTPPPRHAPRRAAAPGPPFHALAAHPAPPTPRHLAVAPPTARMVLMYHMTSKPPTPLTADSAPPCMLRRSRVLHALAAVPEPACRHLMHLHKGTRVQALLKGASRHAPPRGIQMAAPPSAQRALQRLQEALQGGQLVRMAVQALV